jgi:hypothetical protein
MHAATGRGFGPKRAGLQRGSERAGGTARRCCQVTLPKLHDADIKASPAELRSIARFLHHYCNGSMLAAADIVAPGVVLLEPLYASSSAQVNVNARSANAV